MPIVPMGCNVQFHVKPSRRKTFGEHSGDGFYLQTTSSEHYSTHIIFVKKTRAKRLADTVFFKHEYITQPTVMLADAVVQAYHKLVQKIQGMQQSKDDAQMEALE
jgi:dTDP-glucose pyrophosphorylase